MYTGRNLLQSDEGAVPDNVIFFNVSGLLYFYAKSIEVNLLQSKGGDTGFTRFILGPNTKIEGGSKAGNDTGM